MIEVWIFIVDLPRWLFERNLGRGYICLTDRDDACAYAPATGSELRDCGNRFCKMLQAKRQP
jgi:hypothetical protein